MFKLEIERIIFVIFRVSLTKLTIYKFGYLDINRIFFFHNKIYYSNCFNIEKYWIKLFVIKKLDNFRSFPELEGNLI